MNRAIALMLMILCISVVNGQERIAKGRVFDLDSRASLAGIEVGIESTSIFTQTDEAGFFSIEVPDGRWNLIIKADGYDPKSISSRGFHHKTQIYLKPTIIRIQSTKKKLARDSAFLTYKNAISLSIFELGSVAIALRYEHFLTKRQSIGVHLSTYIYGRSDFDEVSDRLYGNEDKFTSTYKGFKLAPFYRFYAYRVPTFGVFIDAKIPFGYFNFDKLEYQFNSNYFGNIGIKHSFWTYGFGLSAGIMFAFPRSKHVFGNLSVGYQYFPVVKGPESIEYQAPNYFISHTYYTNYDWWYMPGPGSTIELKLTLGGIF